MMGTAEANAMITINTANILPPMFPRSPVHTGYRRGVYPSPEASGGGKPREIRSLIRFRFETEVDRLGFVAADVRSLSLSSVVLMPGRDRVLARRQVRQSECPAVAGDGIVIGFEYGEPSVHPGMNLALHRNKFGTVELLHDGRRARWLRFVPLRVNLRHGMDIVRSLVAIHHVQLLPGVQRDDVRNVLAPFLREGDRLGWSVGIVPAGRDIDDNVFEGIVSASHYCFCVDRSRMLLLAAWLLGHADGLLLHGCTGISDLAADGAGEHQCRAQHHNSHGNAGVARTHLLPPRAQTFNVVSTCRRLQLRSAAEWPALPKAFPRRVESSRPLLSARRFPCRDGAPEVCARNVPNPTRRWAEWCRRMRVWECHRRRS